MARMTKGMMDDPPKGGPGEEKTGKIKRIYGYGRDKDGNRTAKADLDTGEKGVDVVWDNSKSQWSVSRPAANKEGDRYKMAEVEIEADRDRSRTPAKDVAARPSAPAPTPGNVPERDVNLGRDKNLRAARDASLGYRDQKGGYTEVTWPGGGAMSSIPGIPSKFKSEDEYKKYVAEHESKKEGDFMANERKLWEQRRKRMNLPVTEEAWQQYAAKQYGD